MSPMMFVHSSGAAGSGSSSTYKTVAGVIRNDGSGWAQIASPHIAINIDGVSSDNSFIYVDYTSIGASQLHTFLAVPDETMAAEGIFAIGSSVGLTQAALRLVRVRRLSAYIYYDGAAWQMLQNTTGNAHAGYEMPTSLSFDTATGVLTVNHPAGYNDWASVSGRSGAYLAQPDSVGNSLIQIVWRDIATGSVVTTPDTKMRVFIERTSSEILDPSSYVSSSGNIWLYGLFS